MIDARFQLEPNAKSADFNAQAQRLTARFDYQSERTDSQYLECQNAKLLAANQQLDYALIELEEADKIADRKPLRLVSAHPKLKRGARMNIPQHPKGGPLRYAIRNNFFVRTADNTAFIFYQTDTEPGASGSPVCNDEWLVIALHHASVTVPSNVVPQEVIDGSPLMITILNEAIQIHKILDDLPTDLRQRISATNGDRIR